jgi:hypothetical protein
MFQTLTHPTDLDEPSSKALRVARYPERSISETTLLAHFGKGRTQPWTLVRIEQSARQE